MTRINKLLVYLVIFVFIYGLLGQYELKASASSLSREKMDPGGTTGYIGDTESTTGSASGSESTGSVSSGPIDLLEKEKDLLEGNEYKGQPDPHGIRDGESSESSAMRPARLSPGEVTPGHAYSEPDPDWARRYLGLPEDTGDTNPDFDETLFSEPDSGTMTPETTTPPISDADVQSGEEYISTAMGDFQSLDTDLSGLSLEELRDQIIADTPQGYIDNGITDRPSRRTGNTQRTYDDNSIITMAELNRITNDPGYGIGYKIDMCLKYQAQHWNDYQNSNSIRVGQVPYPSMFSTRTSTPNIFSTKIPSANEYQQRAIRYQQKQQQAAQAMQAMGQIAGAIAQASRSQRAYSPEGHHAPGTCGRK